jgi:hypothetical protein
LCCLFIISATSSNKKIIYEDETYIVFKEGKYYWMEIGKNHIKGLPVLYIPKSKDLKTWLRVNKIKNDYVYFEIFYKNLPPPLCLLLFSDMIYINSIIYYPEAKVSIVYFNGDPIYFLRALLDKVKNI